MDIVVPFKPNQCGMIDSFDKNINFCNHVMGAHENAFEFVMERVAFVACGDLCKS